MQVIFFISAGFLIYIFLGYPALVFLVSKIVKRPVKKKASMDLSMVTLIVVAYNEARIIKEKIYNTFELDYPKNKLQVLIVSDASSDHTDAIVKSFAARGIEFLRVEGRVGKTECQNQAVRYATGDIVVFSDANSMYDTQAIKNLVKNFTDEHVGCVVGELRYVKNKQSDEGVYWKLEQFLKKAESTIDSCIGANGAIYSIRKNLYSVLPVDAISDFIEPFKIYKQGYRIVYEPSAFCIETTSQNKSEFYRKRRIVARTFSSLKYILSFLNIFQYGWYSVALWSHKILRWFALPIMVILVITTALLSKNLFFLIFLIVQILFYIMACVGIVIKKKPFSTLFLFMVMHISAIMGILDILRGRKIITWKNIRSFS